MGEHDGQGHEFRRLAAGIAEHHSLIPRAERVLCRAGRLVFDGGIHPHGDVGGLFVNRHRNAALVPGESAEIVADAADDLPRRPFVIDFCRRRHFAHDEELIVSGAAFDRRARHRVLRQNRVENAVRDLIADLIRMPFRDAFAGKKLFHVKNPLFNIVRPAGGWDLPAKYRKKSGSGALRPALPPLWFSYYTPFFRLCQLIPRVKPDFPPGFAADAAKSPFRPPFPLAKRAF